MVGRKLLAMASRVCAASLAIGILLCCVCHCLGDMEQQQHDVRRARAVPLSRYGKRGALDSPPFGRVAKAVPLSRYGKRAIPLSRYGKRRLDSAPISCEYTGKADLYRCSNVLS